MRALFNVHFIYVTSPRLGGKPSAFIEESLPDFARGRANFTHDRHHMSHSNPMNLYEEMNGGME
jgi:hypothetical protein